MGITQEAWPAGATWVFQGTVAEDATVGTHVCTLTVTPGAGNEMQWTGGRIQVGATATAQLVSAIIDDGTNTLIDYENADSNTTSGAIYRFGMNFNQITLVGSVGEYISLTPPPIISGTMRLVLTVSTTAVSVTQTFAVVCRLKTGALPTATLADTVGTPTLTTNTNKVF